MKYIPHRKCIACQAIKPKTEMLRFTKSKENLFSFDAAQKSDGRGAYICNHPNCIAEVMKKKSFHRSFKTKVPDECYQELQRYLEETNHAK